MSTINVAHHLLADKDPDRTALRRLTPVELLPIFFGIDPDKTTASS